MDVTALLDTLNDAQRQAVSAPPHAMLILAGAGSGKTRVLVHRIAWQIQVENVSPHSILAVTFTNKAAKEMRGRIESLLAISESSMWIGTFHGIAHRFLRRHATEAGLANTFSVLDSDDQLQIIRRIIKSHQHSEDDELLWKPEEVQHFINSQKEEGRRAAHIGEYELNSYQRAMLPLYYEYERNCKRSSSVDFAELLLRMHELLRDNERLLAHYRQRFQRVYVDEFQDTNTLQYAWLRLLTEGKDNLFVVGDDDQSIYGWRGAKVQNIRDFQSHYPNHQVIKLEQNYRSTRHILDAANQLIDNNQNRLGKNLWTTTHGGELISLYAAFNERDEAYFVIEKIKELRNQGKRLNDIAILYRNNSLSRRFEESLINAKIPYRIYGGLRFFERKEIKDVLAYLRLMSSRDNDASFERIINLPTRGIGEKSLERIRAAAKTQQISLWHATVDLLTAGLFPPKTQASIHQFLVLIKTFDDTAEELPLYEKVKMVVEQSGLIEVYQKEKDNKGEARINNLEELVVVARDYSYADEDEESMNELALFLTHAALEAGEMQAGEGDDCVQLMTLHTSKGLEFDTVFMVGMEEGIFPAGKSSENPERLEEERRLCYVGITRAMRQLFVSYAESRWFYDREQRNSYSRFLREIPAELLQDVRIRGNITQPVTVTTVKPKQIDAIKSAQTFKSGEKVNHEKFGEGVVLQTEGQGSQEKVQIKFKTVGMKWLMLTYAKLDKI